MNAQSEEMNLVENWLRKDPKRWVAGALAGVFAGLVALAVGTVLALITGQPDVWVALKSPALLFLGAPALDYGPNTGAIVAGILVHELLSAFFGFVFAHFTLGTVKIGSLLGLGLSWGAFGWVFVNNLFTPSFRPVFVAAQSKGAAFVVWMAYGAALVSVAFFDRLVRGRRD